MTRLDDEGEAKASRSLKCIRIDGLDLIEKRLKYVALIKSWFCLLKTILGELSEELFASGEFTEGINRKKSTKVIDKRFWTHPMTVILFIHRKMKKETMVLRISDMIFLISAVVHFR